MQIAVIGSGYVGLVTGTCLAETGNDVICVDNDKDKVRRLQQGDVIIYEPELDVLFERNIKQGRLVFTTDLAEAVNKSQLIFLALPTPQGEDGSADLSYVLNVSEELGKLIKEYKVIIDKSTVPVGTSEKVRERIAKNTNVEFDVVSNPEFLREGMAVDDFMRPDRIVIGTRSERAKGIMGKLYAPFVRQGNPVIYMDERSAELTKYAANAYLATRISFMNEIANLCEKVDADVDNVRIGIGSDLRIGKRFLFAGIGYGGSCFPKDVQALANTSDAYVYDFKILKSVIEVNKRQRVFMIEKIKKHYGNDLAGKKFALWGLAFKPNTDDIREAPALYMIDELLKAGVEITAFDPEAMDNVKKVVGDKIKYSKDAYAALTDADALLIVTEWAVFRAPDFDRMNGLMRAPVIFDGRNLYKMDEMKESQFCYYSVGRNAVVPVQV